MEARFGKMPSFDESDRSVHSARSSEREAGSGSSTRSFFARELRALRKTVWTAGSKYNILVSSLLGFLATLTLLLVFRPFFVMRALETPAATDESEYVNPPHFAPAEPAVCADPVVSIGSVLLWSAVVAAAIALLTYFTCKKSESGSDSIAQRM